MDPLSVSASITALLQLTATVVKYLDTARNASKESRGLHSELCDVKTILDILNQQAHQAKQGDPFSSTLQLLNKPDGAIEQLKIALERLERKLSPAVESWKKLGKAIAWPFQKEEVKEILNAIERQKTLFALARQNDHITLSKAIQGNVESLQSDVGEVGKKVDQLHINSNNAAFHQWLGPPDPSSNYNEALKRRHPGTGTWFIESQAFIDWKTAPESFFWLYGKPGCGKTILSSTIIEDVLNHCRFNPNLAVLYFYFDFNDVEKQRQENMIRSLILQLSSQCRSTPQCLEALYTSCLNGGRQPTHAILLATLHQMMNSFGETFVVIDSLDECSERQELLEVVEEMTRWKDANLHILGTSRKEKDIEERIEPLLHHQRKMSIDSVYVNDDIRAYIHERLQVDWKLKRWHKQPKVQQEIEETLMEKADGMFRWAACQLDALRSCLSVHQLRKSLVSLPKDLDETYARILCNIDEDYRQDAVRILKWLTYSARPLRLEEVAEVVAIDVEEGPRFNPEKRFPDPLDIWMICSSLISIQEKVPDSSDDSSVKFFDDSPNEGDSRAIVRLAHFSVKEYLTSPRIRTGRVKDYSIQEVDANASIAESCLAYLLQFDEPGSLTSQSLLESPLAGYAARFWIKHAQVAERGSTSAHPLSIKLFLTQGDGLLNWMRLCHLDTPWRGVDLNRTIHDVCPPLYYASLAGLIKSVESILGRGADINAQGGKDGNALQAASAGGHSQIVQILLDKGADVNAQGGEYGSALQTASLGGHGQIVQMLLDKGADVNAQVGPYGNALQAAACSRGDRVVELLLDKGADVNAQGGAYGNALQAAAFRGGDRVVELLLDKGADVNAQDGPYGNALQAAACSRGDRVVELLLDKGADVNAQGGAYGNALQAAAYSGGDRVVELLLDKGADVNAQGGVYGNALQAAARSGRYRVVELLLDKGADVNAQGGFYGNALRAAKENGHYEIVQMLLDKGAIPDQNRDEGEGPVS